MSDAIALAELAASEFASGIVNDIARKKKMSGMTVAPFVPGLVHDHAPCDFVVDTCAYCRRNGNVFVKDSTGKDTDDIICKYRNRIVKILEDMEKEILEVTNKTMDHENIEDDDDDALEKMLMDELM